MAPSIANHFHVTGRDLNRDCFFQQPCKLDVRNSTFLNVKTGLNGEVGYSPENRGVCEVGGRVRAWPWSVRAAVSPHWCFHFHPQHRETFWTPRQPSLWCFFDTATGSLHYLSQSAPLTQLPGNVFRWNHWLAHMWRLLKAVGPLPPDFFVPFSICLMCVKEKFLNDGLGEFPDRITHMTWENN